MCSRVHLKMLTGDYPCFSYLGSDRSQDASCRLCQSLTQLYPAPDETMVHVLTRCRATSDTRTRLTPDLLNTISQYFPNNNILVNTNHSNLTQFTLDPTSINLPMSMRISPNLTKVLSVCRNLCSAIDKDRTSQLKVLGFKCS